MKGRKRRRTVGWAEGKHATSRSRWPRGLRRGSAAARRLGLRVRIPPEGMSVSCECCVLLGRGPCDGLITRPEESYRLWCVVVCDLETSWMGKSWSNGRNKTMWYLAWHRVDWAQHQPLASAQNVAKNTNWTNSNSIPFTVILVEQPII